MDFWLNIKTFLIDGYLAFEIISKDGQILSLSPLYPSTITFDGATFKQDDKIFTKDQIIYLMYSKVADSHCSCVEELKESYEKMKMAESKVFYIDTVHH
jgi:hypothetical protein